MALISGPVGSPRKLKKIKIRLTRIAVKLPLGEAPGNRRTSSKILISKGFLCHRFDKIEPCTLTIAAAENQTKSPMRAPGFF
jgi:hypothetical protein